MRENYKNIEEIIETGYSIVFLVKKDVKVEEIDYKKIKKDIIKIFSNAKIIVMDEI